MRGDDCDCVGNWGLIRRAILLHGELDGAGERLGFLDCVRVFVDMLGGKSMLADREE